MTQVLNATGAPPGRGAQLDTAQVGDIKGAFGSITGDEPECRSDWKRRLLIFLAIVGPGLIVMVGDNDAGAFGTYAQAGQTYGTSLLWTLLLLVPVLYVNQEIVLRLSIILTASVLFPNMGAGVMLAILGGGAVMTFIGGVVAISRKPDLTDREERGRWRMPPLDKLEPAQMSKARRLWMGVLRGYLLVAAALVLVRIVQLALKHPAVGGA